MSDFDRERDRQRGGQSARGGGDSSSQPTATPGKQTLSAGVPAAQAAPAAPAASGAPAAPNSRPPFDAAAEPIRDQLDRTRPLLVRLTTARATNDHAKVAEVTDELHARLDAARAGIERAKPSPAIDSLRVQLADTEHQAALFIGNADAHDPKSALAAFARAVATAEQAADTLRHEKAAFSFAPPKTVVGGLVEQVQPLLVQAEMAMQAQPPDAGDVIPLAERLDKALTLIGAVARHHDLPLAGIGLDHLFDAEDDIRTKCAGLPRADRANAYYDTNLSARDYDGTTPSAHDVETRLVNADQAAADPKDELHQLETRDDVVKQIWLFGEDIQRALSTGLRHAATIIKEPNQPSPQSIADEVVTAVVKMLTGQATALLGVLVGGAIDAGLTALGGSHLPSSKVTKPIIDGFTKATEDVAIAGGKAATSKARTAGDSDGNSQVTPSSKFLDTAQDAVDKAASYTARNFQTEEKTLKRMPAKELLAVLAALTDSVLADLEREYTDSVIHQWLNLVHDAGAQGKDIRDGKPNPSPSKLDILDTQRLGQIEIFVRLTADHQIELGNAQLVGVTGAMLEHVRKEHRSIGALPLCRRVSGETAEHQLLGDFIIDASGDIQEDAQEASPAWGQLVQPSPADVGAADILAGMKAVRHWLDTIPTDKLHGAG